MPEMNFFPEIEPFSDGMLIVSAIHTLYYEEVGAPNGNLVVYLHGGPGGRLLPKYRQLFDPEFYRVVLFNQRGAGKSTPKGELKENTTWELVEDIEKLREHLNIDCWLLFGGSWGSTLALAYAIKYPLRVIGLIISGVFLGTEPENQWFYQGGIDHIPCRIVQGRYDVVCPANAAWNLTKAMPSAELRIVQDAGHSPFEKGTVSELVQATEDFKSLFVK